MGAGDETRSHSERSPSKPDGSRLEGLTDILGLDPAEPEHDPLLGSDIGGVKIVRRIAEGGMGRVYEGKQGRPSRAVAVKVMRPGLTSPSLLKRFEYEAEVLGRLQHPGIAHIYSVGVHRLGNASVPYFVMEYIADAKTLTKYAEDLKLPTRQRLDLFRSVCDAVAHGHHKGVIHRDLKPSNILVDATGQPKVIDFGVARATDSDMALTTMQTNVGQLIGTLQYMSPEQFDGDPNNIDIRSDVYALGVVLYELLAGKPPYDVKKKAIYEVMRIVKEEEPTALSSVDKTLRRDLRVIAHKCLSKEKTGRYSSASELSEDVSRYLDGAPIAAAPPSFLGFIARFARRRKALAVAIVGIAVSLVATIIGTSLFANKARVAVMRSEDQRYLKSVAAVSNALSHSRIGEASALFRTAEMAFSHSQEQSAKKPIELTLLRPALDGAYVTLDAHDGPVSRVVVSPDGSRIATASRCVHLWDFNTGRLLRVLRAGVGAVADLAYSPKGDQLAATATDGSIYVWHADTGQKLARLAPAASPFRAMAFSPDGTRLAAADDGLVRIWKTRTDWPAAVLDGHSGKILCLSFSPDGTLLLTGGSDGTARLWNVEDGTELAIYDARNGLSNAVHCVAFSPDGGWAAVGSNAVNIWDVRTKKKLAELPIERWAKQLVGERFVSLVFSPKGDCLAIARTSGVTLWEPLSGKFRQDIDGHDGDICAIALSPDDQRLFTVSVDHTSCVWNTSTGDLLHRLVGHTDAVVSIALTGNGRGVVTGSADGTCRIWDAVEKKSLAILEARRASPDASDGLAGVFCPGLSAPAYSSDGKVLAAIRGTGISIWDSRCLTAVAHVTTVGATPECLSVSVDNSMIATGWDDGCVRLYEVASGKQVGVLAGHSEPVTFIAYSPDGSRLASGSLDKSLRLWDLKTAGTVAVFETQASIFGVPCAFHPRNSNLATVTLDNKLQMVDSKSGKVIAKYAMPNRAGLGIYFSPDGTRIVTHGVTERSNFVASLFDSRTLEPLGNFDSEDNEPSELKAGLPDLERGAISKIVFSPDSKRVVTASERFRVVGASLAKSSLVRVWDASTGQPRATLRGNEDLIVGLAVSTDGRRVATASGGDVIRIWDMDTGEPIVAVESEATSISQLLFSPDGSQLLAVGNGAQVLGITNAEIIRSRIAANGRVEDALCDSGQALKSDVPAGLRTSDGLLEPGGSPDTPSRSNPEATLEDFMSELGVHSVTSLTPATAKSLAKHRTGQLCFPRLDDLSPQTAAELAIFSGELHLDGLKFLTREVAEALAAHKGYLDLSGLTEITPAVAEALGRHRGTLVLGGLRNISADVAKLLAHNQGSLVLDGLSSFSASVANALANNTFSLSLNGLTEISPEVGDAFAKRAGAFQVSEEATEAWVVEDLLVRSSISPSGRTILHPKLRLNGLTTLSPEVAGALSSYRGDLELVGLSELSAQVAEAFAQHTGDIRLDGVRSLTPKVAEFLSRHIGGLSLNGITNLEDAVADKLSRSPLANRRLNGDLRDTEHSATVAAEPGSLHLNGLSDISPVAAKALAYSGRCLRLDGLAEITLATAEALGKCQNTLWLNGLTSLSPHAAEALANCKGILCLDGLNSLPLPVAQALAKHNNLLSLSGLETMSADVAAALAKHNNDVFLLMLDDASRSAWDAEINKLQNHTGENTDE